MTSQGDVTVAISRLEAAVTTWPLLQPSGPGLRLHALRANLRKRVSAGILFGTLMLGGLGAPAMAQEAKIELLGAGWPTGTITYLIDAGPEVTRQAIEDISEAAEDWNIALALEDFPDRQMIQFVPARGARPDVVVRLEIAPGPIASRVVHRTITPFSCELVSARVELRGELLGQSKRRAGTRNVARHALGHVLGLGHSDDPNSIMGPTGDTEHGFGATDVAIGRCEACRLWMLHPPIECPLPPLTLCF